MGSVHGPVPARTSARQVREHMSSQVFCFRLPEGKEEWCACAQAHQRMGGKTDVSRVSLSTRSCMEETYEYQRFGTHPLTRGAVAGHVGFADRVV